MRAYRNRSSAFRPPRRSAGFALVEVLVGMVLTAIFVMGLSGLWALAASQTRELTLQQKVVFALNAEMERLTALFSVTSFGAPTSSGGGGGGGLLGGLVCGLFGCSSPPPPQGIYATSGGTFMPSGYFVTTNAATFASTDFHVWYVANYLGADRNFIWIDRDRRLMASMSWELSGLGTGSNCWNFSGNSGSSGGESCKKLVLTLEYPFRLSPSNTVEQLSPLRTLSLSTIVGRRR